jgi:hypothetical protein
MQEKPKPEDGECEDNWSKDQKERGYYYDDSHGYEEYRPEGDEEEIPDGKEEAGASPPSGLANVVI